MVLYTFQFFLLSPTSRKREKLLNETEHVCECKYPYRSVCVTATTSFWTSPQEKKQTAEKQRRVLLTGGAADDVVEFVSRVSIL